MTDTDQFKLEVTGDGIERQIRLTNESENFIEAIFLIDGRDAKSGKPFSTTMRGYAMYPREMRSLTQTPAKTPLQFSDHGQVEVIIYEGAGQPVDSMVEVAPLVRRKIGAKVKIRRFSDVPSAHLTVRY